MHSQQRQGFHTKQTGHWEGVVGTGDGGHGLGGVDVNGRRGCGQHGHGGRGRGGGGRGRLGKTQAEVDGVAGGGGCGLDAEFSHL